MKLLKRLLIFYSLISIITGCGVLVNKITSGSSTSDKDIQSPIISETKDYDPKDSEIVKSDYSKIYKDVQEPIINESIDSQPEVVIPEKDIDDTVNLIDDYSASIITPEPQKVRKIKKKTVPKKVKKKKFIHKKNQSTPVCATGKKITNHWHELKKVVVVTDLLNIRSHYGSNQPVIAGAKRCEHLLVLDKHVERIKGNKKYKSRGWLKIQTQSGTTGWVAGWLTEYIEN